MGVLEQGDETMTQWIKCSERMPLELSDESIDDVEVIVTDGKIVGTCE